MSRRASGILLHVGSLPSAYGIGDLGPAAHRFVDFLAEARQRAWQVLPLNPIDPDLRSCSPYDGASAFAGNPLFISPEFLFRQGLLSRQDLAGVPALAQDRIRYREALRIKTRLLTVACRRLAGAGEQGPFRAFCHEHRDWLEDYALFVALRRQGFSGPWSTWPAPLRDRSPKALAEARRSLAEVLSQVRFEQYLFFRQWQDLRDYGRQRGVAVIGDLPFYVYHNSADMWAHPDLFALTRTKRPRRIGGVPPDAFSKTGQLWGNPVYDWSACRRGHFAWWLRRIRHNLGLFDRVRLDHFRGFAAFWSVRAGSRTAAGGRWHRGPGRDLVGRIHTEFPAGRILAEDLGHITEDVKDLVRDFNLTSMRVLQFAFDGNPAANPHYPHNHPTQCVVYTGTHDNNTAVGWFRTELDRGRKRELEDYVGHRVTLSTVHRDLIRLGLGSPAELAIVPMQDVLCLGPEARMNRPAVTRGNWLWRLRDGQLTAGAARSLAAWTQAFGRA